MPTTTFSIRLEEDAKKQLADTQLLYHQWISAQLKEREKRAIDPDTTWYSHEEFWQKVKEL